MPDITLSTLDVIKTKIRRLTRSPSANQISDAVLEDYINTFVLYDFPEHLRLFSLRSTFTFYTKPYIDVYSTNTTDPTDPMYNFKNNYTSVHKQITIAGYPTMLSQSREQFYGIYPLTSNIEQVGVGDGVTTSFSGTLSKIPIKRDNVLFSGIDLLSNAITVTDTSLPNNTFGTLATPNTGVTIGNVDYLSGVWGVNFTLAPKAGSIINVQTYPFVAARPQAILYYEDQFVVRPIPDQPYPVLLEVYRRPTELLNGNDMPDISEWWQYIAYGAAKKVFEDRLDQESVQMIMPEFKTQERLVLRKTLMNNTNERTSTIYTEQIDISSGISGWGGNNV